MASIKQSTSPDAVAGQSSPNLLNVQADAGEACIANISTPERQMRLRFGIISLVIGLVLLAVLMLGGLDRWWRLPLFLLFAGAASGYFQYADKTCVGLARQDSRKLGDKAEVIEDASELAQIRKQASRVQRKTLIAGVVLTLVALALPVLS